MLELLKEVDFVLHNVNSQCNCIKSFLSSQMYMYSISMWVCTHVFQGFRLSLATNPAGYRLGYGSCFPIVVICGVFLQLKCSAHEQPHYKRFQCCWSLKNSNSHHWENLYCESTNAHVMHANNVCKITNNIKCKDLLCIMKMCNEMYSVYSTYQTSKYVVVFFTYCTYLYTYLWF